MLLNISASLFPDGLLGLQVGPIVFHEFSRESHTKSPSPR
jgi:hypothetical protein